MRITLLLLILLAFGCSKDNTTDCDNLKEALINKDLEMLQSKFNTILSNMEPNPNEQDPLGHENNLNNFVELFNIKCESLEFSVRCYACIYTNPAQSEVQISIQDEIRIIDIKTPKDEPLEFIKIHE